MKILSDEKLQSIINLAKYEGYVEGLKKGEKDGYKRGLTEDKSGVLVNATGVYIFNNGKYTNVHYKEGF